MREASRQIPRPRKLGAFPLFQGSLKLNATRYTEMASVFYELDYLEYEPCPRYQHLPLPSNGTAFSWIYEPDARRSMHDDDFC